MKKLMLIFSTLSILMGCTKELTPKSGLSIEREFSASFIDETKTSLEPSGKVNWSKGDVVSYYTASDGAVSTTTVPEDSHSFSFTAKVGVDDSFIVAAYGGTISAPQGKSMTLSGVVEQEQSGKFEDAHVSVCKRYFENGNVLSFKNITSLIKFTLTRTDVGYITFTAGKGEKIHGDGKIYFSFSGEDISAAFGEKEGGSDIKVNTNGAGTFYMSTLPQPIEGFTVKYFDNAGKAIGMTTSAKTLTLAKGNSIVNLGVLDSKIEDIPPFDLSANGTANCYIASELGYSYKFKANVKGNSTESVGVIKKSKVLWESFGTDVTPKVGDVVADVELDGEYIKFNAISNGNAVIAAVDADGDPLWSWHIWVCGGFDPVKTAQVYNNDAGTMMDRNLGATSATPGDVHALGLLYQWGRKDPFLSGEKISYGSSSNQQQAASTLSWPSPVSSDVSQGTIAYAIAHPTTFITRNANNGDWYYTGLLSTDNTRWQTSEKAKGIYDPCPQGWRVPDGGSNGVWSKAFGISFGWRTASNWDSTNNGMNFGSTDETLGTGTIWYPAAGYRNRGDGLLCYVGSYGNYWSCAPDGSCAYNFGFNYDGNVGPSYGYYRAYGQSVRCLKDESRPQPEPENYVDLGLSVKWATCNIGATKPEEYGRYFAWGDVVGQTWDGTKWSGGGFSTYPSYELDAKGNLKPEYDAAHVLLGGNWRMPTHDEQQELINNCTSTWTNIGGVNGRLFTSKKSGYTDKSIFLPAAGRGGDSYLNFAGSDGDYWSSTFYYDDAWSLYFDSDAVSTTNYLRYYGFSVRPVSE